MAPFFGRDKEGAGGGGAEQPGAYPAGGQETEPREQPTREQPAGEEGYGRDHVYGQAAQQPGRPAQAHAVAQAQETEPREQPTDAEVKDEPRPEDDPEYKRRLEASRREGNADDEYQWHTGAQRPT